MQTGGGPAAGGGGGQGVAFAPLQLGPEIREMGPAERGNVNGSISVPLDDTYGAVVMRLAFREDADIICVSVEGINNVAEFVVYR
jgi:hypothetical protein